MEEYEAEWRSMRKGSWEGAGGRGGKGNWEGVGGRGQLRGSRWERTIGR